MAEFEINYRFEKLRDISELMDLARAVEKAKEEYAIAAANAYGSGLRIKIYDWQTQYFIDTSIKKGFTITETIPGDPPKEE